MLQLVLQYSERAFFSFTICLLLLILVQLIVCVLYIFDKKITQTCKQIRFVFQFTNHDRYKGYSQYAMATPCKTIVLIG